MKIAGVLLLVAGWTIVLAAVALFKPAAAAARTTFICAGMLVEAIGLVCLVRSNLPKTVRGDNV